MQTERHYEFRKRMSQIHPKNIRNYSLQCADNEIMLSAGCRIGISDITDETLITAAKDFADYLFTSMNVSAMICCENMIDADIYIEKAKDDFSSRAYSIEFSDTIKIKGFDSWSCAQALYLLEDIMTVRKAPFIEKKDIHRIIRFSPRMVHSGFGLDEFPDEHLNFIAHSGRDAILVFAKETDLTPYGYLDFNNLIRRAGKYGLDVYAYSYLTITMHPQEKDAAQAYDAVYGELFKNCPGLKGIVLVGESVEFESKDKNVGRCGPEPEDNVPSGKPRPGWYPCEDFPLWLELVKNTIRKYKADADVVFWTYNWGWADEKSRIKLINTLPTDISLMATFEMFEKYTKGDITEYTSDYTIAFEGPGRYFSSEAEAASKRGIKLYSMTNTGGMTWDMGVIPYVPVPGQWMKRYAKMLEAAEKWGLCGVMESHHYGFYPSFIADLSARVFDIGADIADDTLDFALSKHFGAENTVQIKSALAFWSEAITHFTTSNEDQYGPWRVGTAYPFVLKRKVNVPCSKHAMFGSSICFTSYPDFPVNDHPNNSAPALRMPREIEFLNKAFELFGKGLEILDGILNPNDELLRLINLGKFIGCMITTTINIKKWYLAKTALSIEQNLDHANKLIDELENIAICEIDNANKSIPLVEYDSRLGWEPSMEYVCHRENIEWKIRHLTYVLNSEIPDIRKSFNT